LVYEILPLKIPLPVVSKLPLTNPNEVICAEPLTVPAGIVPPPLPSMTYTMPYSIWQTAKAPMLMLDP